MEAWENAERMNRKTILKLCLVFGLAPCLLAQTAAPSQEASCSGTEAKTHVVMLGTGTPIIDPERSGPAVAVVVHCKPYLVDFGAGVVRRAALAAKAGHPELRPINIKIAFATHLHSDHTSGLSDLFLTPAVVGRKAPLELYGPEGLSEMAKHIRTAYAPDIELRIKGLEHGDPAAYEMKVHEIKPGVVYRDEYVTVKAFLVKHGSWKESYGYRFEAADRMIVISGDTVPTEAIVENCQGCDLLIHEVYSLAGFKKLPEADQQYHSHFHTSTVELAELATRARPKLLVLYHQVFFKQPAESLLKEVQDNYPGKVAMANDLDVF